MRFLDLFCGAGGAAAGMHLAYPDAEIIGIDNRMQKHYPFTFVLGDALNPPFDLSQFDFIWASPPCQRYSVMTKRWQHEKENNHPDLVDPIRVILQRTGKPFVIENVVGAPLKYATVLLCGTMFGLGTKEGNQLRRHRLFEVCPGIGLTPPCQHNNGSVVGVYGGRQNPKRKRLATVGVWGHAGGHSNQDGRVFFGTDARREAMGIDWMMGDELSEAIPPAYSEYILKQLRLT